MNYAVIGANYGDEGKGLVTDFLTRHGNQKVVIRHNGGAQSGHTVEKETGERFVFHELSSGSFNGAITYWANTFYPDLFKLEEEINEFSKVSEVVPKIFASKDTPITLIFDVMINQHKELERGKNRHGSCGMGIWEAKVRTEAGFGITISEIKEGTIIDLITKLDMIKRYYVPKKINNAQYDIDLTEYAKVLKRAANIITIVEDEPTFFELFDTIVFETGQGLLLDGDRVDLYPHTTASCTTLKNPLYLAERYNIDIDEAIYVTRPYLTRHGAGPFDVDLDIHFEDLTNQPNPWQESIRFGRIDMEDLKNRIWEDNQGHGIGAKKTSLFVTHLDETDSKFLTTKGDLDIKTALNDISYDKYVCFDRYGINVKKVR